MICIEGSTCVEREGLALCECEPGYEPTGNECHKPKDVRGLNVMFLVGAAAVGIVLVTISVLLKYRKQMTLSMQSSKKGMFKYRPLDDNIISTVSA